MKVSINRQVLEAMLSFALEQHPREVVLLLSGKREKGDIHIEEFLFPPFASTGRGFAQFPPHMLPIDFSVVGTAHSHPSGTMAPSPTDLNHFYGRILLILAYPYDERHLAAFNSSGESRSIIIK